MTIEDDIACLERIPILRRLGASALRIIAVGAEGYRVETGQVLFKAGEPADGAYVVQQGSFALQDDRGAENEVIAGAGTLLGESALLAETKWLATAMAREDATVLRIPRAMFLKMLEGYPDAARRLREVIAARSEQWADEMESVRAALTPRSKPK